MGEVRIRINGRDYDVACDDGQESRVKELGQFIDKTYRDIAKAGAASNEAHLFVLTSLVLADEVHELRQQMQELQEQAVQPQSGVTPPDQSDNDALGVAEACELRDAISAIASRVDDLADRIEQT